MREEILGKEKKIEKLELQEEIIDCDESEDSAEFPTELDDFYLDWILEQKGKELNLFNSILSKTITINAAFAGGAVIQKEIEDPAFKAFLIALFLIGLLFSYWGFLPYEKGSEKIRNKNNELKEGVYFNDPDSIRKYQEDSKKHKKKYLYLSIGFTIAGFLLVIGHIISKIFH